ncbi:hypothetical protein N7G274_003374 [Stereocaulon virgatum]|uniref:Rhodopsin domain-containing protein n=1 Tax=Stereocaulon virgatum TaxID=373712 RepID=A0ABR4AEH6_9LECA
MATLDPSTTPSLQPPAGVQPNFVDPKSLVPILIDTTIICLCFATFATAARLTLKLRNIRSLQWEDYSAFTAWGGFVAYNALQVLAADLGEGRHQWDVTLASLTQLLLVFNIIEILYGPLVFVAKFTILLQFRKIFCPSKRGTIFWCIHALIWANLTFYLVDTFIVAFVCTPRAKINHPELPGHCLKSQVNFIVTGGWNVFSDFSILILPLSSIWNLQMATRKKLQISAVFATGLFACVSSIIRLVYSVKMSHEVDTTYIIGKVAMWSCAEVTTVILAGSLPVLPKFFQLVLGKLEFLRHLTRSDRSGHSQKRATIASHSTNHSNPRSIAPWARPDDATWQLNDSYIPLREPDATHIAATKAQVTGGHGQYPTESRAFSDSDLDMENGLHDGIRKTVKIETSRP